METKTTALSNREAIIFSLVLFALTTCILTLAPTKSIEQYLQDMKNTAASSAGSAGT